MCKHALRLMRLASLMIACAFAAPVYSQAPGERSAMTPTDCDYDCLIGFARGYMLALAKQKPKLVSFAPHARFTENDVELRLGQGLWATVTSVAPSGLEAADVQTGYAAWIGTAEEHGAPVYFGVRLRVLDRAIVEAQTIVVRNTGLPLPFGDVNKIVHDPAFAEPLKPEQRRPRERLIAVADSYFSTVELNDGQVFAPFHDDCARLENGIATTSAGPGSAGAIAPGCEAQFKLGIYRINKRVRERRYTLVDEERGVVVATGFFDHANEFDRYRTTDGVERKTALKWPNSISLIEAFKIVDGKIHRIEAIFTYVPYFMHSPLYPAPPRAAKFRPKFKSKESCDRACLVSLADRYVDAMIKKEPRRLPWAPTVRFTENAVPMMIGDGLWGSIRGKADAALRIADTQSGSVAWYGVVYEHDAPAYLGLTLRIEAGEIAQVDAVVARARNPGPFGDPTAFKIDPALDQALPTDQSVSRRKLAALVDGYARSMERNDGRVFVPFAPTCERIENGASVTHGAGGSAVIVKSAAQLAQGCEAQLKLALYRPIDRIRTRRAPLVDVERGLAVSISFADFPMGETSYLTTDGQRLQTQDSYPSSRQLFEVFRVRGGKIERIEAISVYQPFGMP